MPAKTFRDLIVWQEAYGLTLEIYRITKAFPKDELYGLTGQVRRAAISVTSNIAEGFGRAGAKEKDQFYAMAHGSLAEVESQLMVAVGIGYLVQEEYEKIELICDKTSRLLQGLRRANKERGVRV